MSRKVRSDALHGKRCKKCGKTRPIEEFHVAKGNKDGRKGSCKFCCNEKDAIYASNPKIAELKRQNAIKYYYQNKNKVRLANGERYLQNKLRAIAVLGSACQECGEKHPAALQFHHRDPATKKFVIGSHTLTATKKFTWEMLLEEIKKCDLLCANCHSKHHSTVQFVDGKWQVLL